LSRDLQGCRANAIIYQKHGKIKLFIHINIDNTLFWCNVLSMFKGEFKFNLTDALMERGPQYCRAYHATNEPINEWLKLTPATHPRVLTVAASGDQPLMYATAGTSQVDTFDITINACAVMDFKTSALQLITNFSEYKDIIQNLFQLDHLDKISTQQYATFMHIVKNMPIRTRPLVQNILKKHCNQTAFSQHTSRNLRFPADDTQFAQVQSQTRAPFNFIWSELTNVHHYIDETYDIINVSNIFDHYLWYKNSPKSVFDAITSLWPYLRRGGYMLCTTSDYYHIDTIELISTNIAKIQANIIPYFNPTQRPWQAIVLQKTR